MSNDREDVVLATGAPRSFTLLRTRSEGNETIGSLSGMGFFARTLEPKCPVPCGLYTARLRFSASHGYAVFGLLNVPGHSDIEIHSGNTCEDTKGCILLGDKVSGGFPVHDALRFPGCTELLGVENSRNTLCSFMSLLGVPNYKSLFSWDDVRTFVLTHPEAETFSLEIRTA